MNQSYFYLCVLFLSITFFSCQEDEIVYSSDKSVDTWVKENLNDIQLMDRPEWLQLDEGVNRATYVAFSQSQKHKFWLNKIKEVLLLNWNEKESQHLKLLYQTVSSNPQWFSTNFLKDEEEYEKFHIFIYEWAEYSKESLYWNNNLIGAIIASGNKLVDKTGRIHINSKPSVRLKNSSEVKCDCHVGNVVFTTCGGPTGRYCEDDPCVESIHGCGAFWTEACDGYCR